MKSWIKRLINWFKMRFKVRKYQNDPYLNEIVKRAKERRENDSSSKFSIKARYQSPTGGYTKAPINQTQ